MRFFDLPRLLPWVAQVPRQRRGESLRDASGLERWLELQDPHQAGMVDDDAEDLFEIHNLVITGAPRAQLNAAVRMARDDGWGWAPIAMALGESAAHAQSRYGTHS